jgi:leucyl aminopeptidase
VPEEFNFWLLGSLALTLPANEYYFENVGDDLYGAYALGFGLGTYQYSRYKPSNKPMAKLYLPAECQADVLNQIEAIFLVRDLINTPTQDLGPSEFAAIAADLAKSYGAKYKEIIGEQLLLENYPLIHAVGRACDDAPRLVDITWGKPGDPLLTLVGKGVCFDSGGLNLKGGSHMQLMKKDMGGAAHTLGLARMIMQANLPIRLRVLIPLVENSVGGNAYRPGDVFISRQGLSVEVGNTDAEGRLVLADALAEAASEKPELIIDIATLTGAARIALGTELPVMFANDDLIADRMISIGEKLADPMWRLPLYAPYGDYIESQIADLNNNSSEPYGGAITAALFLERFVSKEIPWVHFDLMAWNLRAKAGRPQGGEAMVIRALWHYLNKYFKSSP